MYAKKSISAHNNGDNFILYTYDEDVSNSWQRESGNKSIQQALDYRKWDIVTFGNQSAYTVDDASASDTHNPHVLDKYVQLLNEVALYVKTNGDAKKPVKIGSLSVCNAISRTCNAISRTCNASSEDGGITYKTGKFNYRYDDDEESSSIPCPTGGPNGSPITRSNKDWPTIKQIFGWTIADVEKVLEETPSSFIIPCWTAIMNAYTVPDVREIGYYGDNGVWIYNPGCKGYLRRDGRHLQEGLPRQIVAYTVVESLLRLIGSPCSILGDDTRFDSEYLSSLGLIPGRPTSESQKVPTGYPLDEDDSERNIRFAQKCAIMAVQHPYEQTDMNQWFNTVDLTDDESDPDDEDDKDDEDENNQE